MSYHIGPRLLALGHGRMICAALSVNRPLGEDIFARRAVQRSAKYDSMKYVGEGRDI